MSAGADSNPEWANLHEEIIRAGHAWIGVSAQRIGVVGGPVLVDVAGAGARVAGKGLTKIDPDRYGSLAHPGDGFSFDIVTKIARAARTGAALGGRRPLRLIAAGDSQSAYALVTYYNGVQPLTRALDGFLVQSRGATSLPLVGPGEGADLAAALGGTPAMFRTDQEALVLDLQTESDPTGVLDSQRARQPDNDHLRLREVSGTSHADAHLIGPAAGALGCGTINNGPLHLVAKAGLRALAAWLVTGRPPPVAPRLEVAEGSAPRIRRDPDGITLGGIRTPPVDTPVTALSGEPGPNPSTICLLTGSTQPLPASRLAKLYSSPEDYEKRYRDAADVAIRAGFVLSEDRPALLAFAEPARISG